MIQAYTTWWTWYCVKIFFKGRTNMVYLYNFTCSISLHQSENFKVKGWGKNSSKLIFILDNFVLWSYISSRYERFFFSNILLADCRSIGKRSRSVMIFHDMKELLDSQSMTGVLRIAAAFCMSHQQDTIGSFSLLSGLNHLLWLISDVHFYPLLVHIYR